ncbi:hypothetical protein ACIBCB_20845 [Streptomyces uncialis]|uniref:hypothetical protein n=1 Tax=Streptomyces uncialis TaxID=1048205 RepID=UPI0037B073D3|nr:hypothetical protein OG924_36010 [Streptomyces uncialis]
MSATFPLAALARTAEPVTMLRRFLALDAVVTGVNGVAYLAASGPLSRLLGVDAGLLVALGVFLTLYGLGVAALGAQRSPGTLPVRLVVEANAVWAVASLVALVFWLTPTTVGAVWVPMQAVTVGGFALLQHLALRAVRNAGPRG